MRDKEDFPLSWSGLVRVGEVRGLVKAESQSARQATVDLLAATAGPCRQPAATGICRRAAGALYFTNYNLEISNISIRQERPATCSLLVKYPHHDSKVHRLDEI